MRCRYCEEYDIDSYEYCVPGETCPNCGEYTIPEEEE